MSLRKKKKKKTVIKRRKILADKIKESSAILIGEMRETKPKTKVIVMITPPIKSPKINQSSPLLALSKEKKVSGKVSPIPTIKIPIKERGR